MVFALILIAVFILFLAMAVTDVSDEIARSNELKEAQMRANGIAIPERLDD
jgi:cell division protein FtsL